MNYRNFVALAAVALLPPQTTNHSFGLKQAQAEVQNITDACFKGVGAALVHDIFKEEHLGNRSVRDEQLADLIQDLEAAGVEWCANGMMDGVNIHCMVIDRANSRIVCGAKSSSSEPIATQFDFEIIEPCVPRMDELNRFMGRIQTVAEQEGIHFELKNPSTYSFVNKAVQVCERWEMVKP